MTPRSLLAPAVALTLVLGACGSDDDASDEETTEEDSSTTVAEGGDAAVDECVDGIITFLEDADFADQEALSQEFSTELGPQCASLDQVAVGDALDARDDELSDEAFQFLYQQTREEAAAAEAAAEAADVSGDPCVALSEPLPEGAPDVPVPVGPPPAELVIDDLEAGDGATVEEGATVAVDYIGVSCSTGVIFDNSYERGEPAEFPLDGVISGWSEGLLGMKEGGTRLLVIPPDQGYGDQGSPPDIAPGETLVFVVELRSVS